MMQLFIFISALLFLLIVEISTVGIRAQTKPSVLNPKFQVERIFTGDFEPSSMVFWAPMISLYSTEMKAKFSE